MKNYNFYINNDNGSKTVYNTSFLAKIDGRVIGFDELPKYDEKMKEAFQSITKLGNRRIDVSHVYSNFHSSPVTSNLAYFDSMRDEISKMVDILENGGRVVGFDTETIGSTKSPFITEVGLSIRNYEAEGKLVSERKISYPVMLDAKGQNVLHEALETYKNGSNWDDLTNTQKVALKRASVYANAASNIGQDASGVFVLNALGEETTNIKTIEKGVDYLTGRQGLINTVAIPGATEGESADIIKRFADMLMEYAQDENTVIYGANTGFDINGIKQNLRASGHADTASNFALMMNKKAIDEMAIVRAIAEDNGESPARFLSNRFGIHVPDVSMASQLKALGVPSIQLHMSGPDSANEIEPMVSLKPWIKNLLDKDISDKLPESASKQSAFYFYNGIIDKNNGREFGIINGKPTRNIGITNQFWVIDQYRSGMTEDGMQRLTFKSLDDKRKGVKKPMGFSIERRPEEVAEFIGLNAVVFESADEISEIASNVFCE